MENFNPTDSEFNPTNPEENREDAELETTKLELEAKKRRTILYFVSAIVALALIVVGLFIWLATNRAELNEVRQANEQLMLENEMMQSANEFAQIESEFAAMENQTQLLANDSIVEKYAAARAQVEKLMEELRNEKNKSAAQIKKLQDEIATLKGILRDYVQRINELMAENEGLRSENASVKWQNARLSNQVQQVTKSNEELTERMTLAEKLNVSGLNFVALNKKDKNEKRITKAVRLMATFTLPQNNSTPPGEKTIYMRITSPEGNVLTGNGGTFDFEGTSLAATARTTIEYANEEIGGVKIYWDVNTTLNPGDYKVEIFADNYRLASRSFTMK